MPKTTFHAWVKNVHNLRIAQGETVGKVSTPARSFTHIHSLPVKKHSVIPSLVHGFYPQLFTVIFAKSPLLYTQLYPLSTPPIIKRKKEN